MTSHVLTADDAELLTAEPRAPVRRGIPPEVEFSLKSLPYWPEGYPHISELVIEDDTPVANIFSEKQQRLLPATLHSSWTPKDGRPFVAMADVSVFHPARPTPLVPDVLLSCGVKLPQDMRPKVHRCYLTWMYGKPPDVVIEIVSNDEGDEEDSRLHGYEEMGVPYYVIFDPEAHLSKQLVRVFALNKRKKYQPRKSAMFPDVGLGLTLWTGRFEDMELGIDPAAIK